MKTQYLCIVKLISITILFVCALAASFTNSILILAFDLNQKYIATELCVNKNDPHSHCNGHCYLSRQLQKEENSNTPISGSSKEKNEIQLFCNDIPDIITVQSHLATNTHTHNYFFTAQDYENSFFHPPSIA